MPIKKYNEYQIVDDYVVMKTNNGYEFLIDLEDLNKVKDICWCSDKKGYLLGWDTNLKKDGQIKSINYELSRRLICRPYWRK